MEEVVARMERLWGQQGPDLATTLQQQALLDLAMSVVFFLVATHIAAVVWKLRLAQGPQAPLALRIWSVFLLVPVLLFATRLTSGDILWAALGDPLPLLAATATMGLDSLPGGPHTPPTSGALTEAVIHSLEGRAFQILWPMIFLAGLCVWAIDRWRRAGFPLTSLALARILPAFAVLALTFPVVADRNLWAALQGRPEGLLDTMLRPAIVLDAAGQRVVPSGSTTIPHSPEDTGVGP